jgi:predicted aspartyl protease
MNALARSAAIAVLAALLPPTAPVSKQIDVSSYPLSLTRGSRLMIDAKINGRSVPALLDSAADTTILDSKFAQTLNLKSGQAVAGQGSGQASFEATLVSGVKLEALGLSLENQTVAIADLTDVGRRLLNHPIDVILGREIFDAARLAIDINGRRIAVVSRDQEPRGVKLELVTEHGVETVPVRVETGPPVRATFDLGNGSHVLISKSFATRMNLLVDGREVTTEHGGGLGGEATRQVLTLRVLEVAGGRFRNVKAAIDPQPSASDVNIGVSVLRHFRITTDFTNHVLWLDPRG